MGSKSKTNLIKSYENSKKEAEQKLKKQQKPACRRQGKRSGYNK